MGRKIWLALALAVIVAASFVASAVATKHKAASDPRPKTVTKGLDFFHSRQKADGGFGTMAATAWVILGAVASGERIGSTMWTVDGNNPFGYLQAHSHEAAATGPDVDNAPVYYARAIMSYVAADRAERVFVAGTPRIDLLAKLYSYQDLVEGSLTKGSFSPATSSRKFQAVHTTAWAILAMQALGEDGKDRFALAEQWLATQQLADGGFPAQSGDPSNCEDTAVAIQALVLAANDSLDPAIIPAARQYLKANQNVGGGFPYKPSTGTTGTDAWATSAAIQAILAMGEKPDGVDWTVGANTPKSALGALQLQNGAYNKKRGDATGPLPTTSWALVALRDKPFTTFPRVRPPALKAFVFRPQVGTVLPKNGEKFTNTRAVLIRATYTDGAKGTGVNPKACRVYVDDRNKTKQADIGRYALRLQLENVANGLHKYRLEIVDHAGNVKKVERRFTMAIPAPTPTSPPTYVPVPNPPYTPPATIYPTPTSKATPTPYTTLTPTTYPSIDTTSTPTPYQSGAYPVTGVPVASPSPSGSPGAAGDDGSGSAAGFLGGTLLAMLPIGAAISYVALRRREQALSAAGEGKVLGGGGSGWERLKGAFVKSKDLVKPAGR
ncbi:MAG: terpene cyclase/mutase family protein [Actinobacteria bacterium]|nr:terpene cyclase/mutase family protein [Actinomycetota bacterium]